MRFLGGKYIGTGDCLEMGDEIMSSKGDILGLAYGLIVVNI